MHFLDSIEVAHPRASVASELWGQRGTLYPPSSGLVPPAKMRYESKMRLMSKFKSKRL